MGEKVVSLSYSSTIFHGHSFIISLLYITPIEIGYKNRCLIYAFELWCWRTLLGVPCTSRRSNQSVLKEISPEYLLEGLMLKLKLQYFGHLM